MKALALLALALGALVWLARPYSLDLLRYGLWRVSAGGAFVAGTVDSLGARIGYRTIGPLAPIARSRPSLVLLHGGFGSDLDWYAEVPALARDRALVLLDTRGHGSSTLGTRPLSYRLFARDVVAVLDALGLGTVDVVGWSDGGNTALALALEHPRRVRRLIAISANARLEGLVPRMRDALATKGSMGSLPARLWRALWSPEPGRWDELDEGVSDLWRGEAHFDDAELAAIDTPTLLIAGSADDVSRGHLDELARILPDARLAVLPGVGHSVPQSAPAEVLALIDAFLEDRDSPDARRPVPPVTTATE